MLGLPSKLKLSLYIMKKKYLLIQCYSEMIVKSVSTIEKHK